MTQRQADGQESGAPQVFVLRTFHVDHTKWTRFGEVAESLGSSRAAEIRRLIDSSLEEFERERAA